MLLKKMYNEHSCSAFEGKRILIKYVFYKHIGPITKYMKLQSNYFDNLPSAEEVFEIFDIWSKIKKSKKQH